MKLSLIFFAFLISFITSDKGMRGHVKANLHIVRSINPEDNSFEDLFEIGNAIGDAKLVLLGEQCHGDGATFAAKSRLIKYLHEKKGFNVLAFEADFFALNDSQDQRRGINSIWSAAEECNYLLNSYIPSTNSTDAPLVISGIDNQFYGQIGSNRLKDFLKTAAKSDLFDKDISPTMDEDFYSSWDSLKSSLVKNQQQLLNPSASYLSLLDKYNTSLSILLSSATKQSNSFGFQVIKNIQAFNNQKRTDLANESFTMRLIGHGNLKMNWQAKFDGIFYIKEMYPSHKVTK